MRRLITALATSALLVGALALPVAAAGPRCSHFLSADPDEPGTLSNASLQDGVVLGRFFLDGKSCKQVTYTLHVLDNDGDTQPIASASVKGDGSSNFVVIEIPGVSVADGDVCLYVTATVGKKKVMDVAPDDGCVVRFDDGSSPGGGKGF